VSGAILESIIDRSKESAIRRSLEDLNAQTGLNTGDIIDAIDKEFLENDILPQSDQVEDWVQLLDMKSDNCVAVRSRRKNQDKFGTKSYGTRSLKSIV
jgi:proteasome-associated ATPase